MEKSFIRMLTGRRFVQGLFVAASSVLLLVAVLGQGRRGAEGPGPVNPFAPSEVFASWWFAVLVSLFLLSLVVSTIQQFSAALAQLRSVFAGDSVSRQDARLLAGVVRELEALGYRRVMRRDGTVKYVKSAWGFFGRPLLHLGLGTAIVFSALYFLTESRAVVRVVEGVALATSDAMKSMSRGPLQAALRLPQGVRLVSFNPQFWPNDQVKSLSSIVELIEADAPPESREIGVSAHGRYRGMIVYHQGAFGRTFVLEGQDDQGVPVREALTIPMPRNRETPGYENFPLQSRYLLKAKFYTDIARGGMVSDSPQLVLRLLRGDVPIGELTLVPGESGRLGPFSLTLKKVGWWTEVLFEGSRGAPGIFFGFFLMVAGGLLTYYAAPREALIREYGETFDLTWRASRFGQFYEEERNRLMRVGGRDA